MKSLIITIILGLGIILLVAWRCKIAHTAPVVKVVTRKEIMSIRELQQFLKDTGNPRYDIGPKGVDGDLGGPESCTRKAWSNYICDRQAGKEFK